MSKYFERVRPQAAGQGNLALLCQGHAQTRRQGPRCQEANAQAMDLFDDRLGNTAAEDQDGLTDVDVL